jgi:1,4-alpha-glucan branching enzyme
MHPAVDPEGCPCFEASVQFAPQSAGEVFQWGVKLDGPAGRDLWGIASEVEDENSAARERSFTLTAEGQTEFYYLTCCSRLGARKQLVPSRSPGIRFSLWAPNARAVDLVPADPARGYVADDGTGALRVIPMAPAGQGIWQVASGADPMLADFAQAVGTQYMFRVTKDDGSVAFRTDMYSRKQIGQGDFNPGGQAVSRTTCFA